MTTSMTTEAGGERAWARSLFFEVAALLLAMQMLWAAVAHAHGDFDPKHGGIMSFGGEISFEFVVKEDGVTLYVEDHGTPVETEGSRGKLVVLGSSPERTVALVPAGGNTLVARDFRPAPGARLRILVDFADGSITMAQVTAAKS
jgi:hypothetical protein